MKLSKQPPDGYVNHVRESALLAEEGLKQWPDELDAAIKWVVKERRKKLK